MIRTIDLRSDTVTKPTPGMLDAMFSAEVGDDVFNEDPTVNRLEEKVANMFGMESAIFCPSGTMTNQIALNILSRPFEEIVCYEGSHVYRYEGGGAAGNSGLSFKLLKGHRGRLSLDEVKGAINPDDVHFPKTTIVELENTVNKGGGCYYKLSDIHEISAFAKSQGLGMHLDGARLFNALAETGEKPTEYGAKFDTISVCMSKGLGAPIGSLLIGSLDNINKARRMRKVFGGGMRQAGFLAAACIYALDHQRERLTEDHRRAKVLGNALSSLDFVDQVLPVDTNIVIYSLREHSSEQMLEILKDQGILAVPFGPKELRFVTHLDFDDNQLETTISKLRKLNL